MNKSHRRVIFPMGTNKPINITIMKTFTFYYRMFIDIEAENREEADEIFDNMPFDELFNKSDFIEVNNVYESTLEE